MRRVTLRFRAALLSIRATRYATPWDSILKRYTPTPFERGGGCFHAKGITPTANLNSSEKRDVLIEFTLS